MASLDGKADLRCLVVEDDLSFAEILDVSLAKDCETVVTRSIREATTLISKNSFELILLDLGLPDGDGVTLLPTIARELPNARTVVVTMSREIRKAVEAVQLGAAEYVTKDLGLDEILRVVRRTIQGLAEERELTVLREDVALKSQLLFSSDSSRMKGVEELIAQVAPLPTTVLIQGESGTGKELVAREIHRRSRMGRGPFVALNVAAVPEELVESTLFGHDKGAFTNAHQQRIGKFELASGGTLFLDEVGCMSLALQTKILRVIQEREFERLGGSQKLKFSGRLVVATHRDLPDEIAKGRFREDLYFRLNVYPIVIPPLRLRTEQIPLLGRYFLERYLGEFGKPVVQVRPEVWRKLATYPWPGNVRELENLMQRLAVLNQGDEVDLTALPSEFTRIESSTATSLPDAVDRFESELILAALARKGGNQRLAAQELQIPLSTLKFKLRRHRLTQSGSEGDSGSVLHSV